MAKLLTFIDSGVLITAARSKDIALRQRAFAILSSPQRNFASSRFVWLEVMPKAIWIGNQAERSLYETFFNAVGHWPQTHDAVIAQAEIEAAAVGLGSMDALHIAAAVLLGADELVTAEGPTKSIHRTKSIKVISIR
ncbi:MAG: nucleic acid-binding protein [Acidobacteriota bacterium]|nr:nucleic acid-binding protein [Acidobacteriota bacterium]